MGTMTLSLNGVELAPQTASEMIEAVRDHLSSGQYADVWLSDGGGREMSMLVSVERAWLMYLVNVDEECWHTGSADEGPVSESMAEFQLANGQVDRYPLSWTIPVTDALTGLQYFFRTQLRHPDIPWIQDF